MPVKLFLTGKPGIGKTTAVINVIKTQPEKFTGFYTKEVRENGKRIGFNIITTWNSSYVLSRIGIEGPRVSKYGVDLKGLEAVVEELEARRKSSILVVDEIGKMELLSLKFRTWIEKIISDPNQSLLATIPINSREPIIMHIRSKFPVWEITYENRNTISYKIAEYFKELLP